MSKRKSTSKSSPGLKSSTGNAGVLDKADNAVSMESDGEDEMPSTQPADDRVLKDVVAFVEVRSNTENRSRSVGKQLEILGATVVRKFGSDVTHVIWKEGKKSTKDKAIKKGLHLVSVLWVDSCKQNQEHVAESLFPVHDPADGSPLVLAKLKRVKSMQPKSLEEELQDGGIRKRRRKRKLVVEDFEPLCLKNGSPSVRPNPRILVAETQPPLSPLIIGPNLTPTLSLIPNTPESMRRALDSLSKRKNGTPNRKIFSNADDSPTSALAAPLLNKKLFLSSATSAGSSTDNSHPPGCSSKDNSDSSDTEKQQRPAKRQRLSSGKKDQESEEDNQRQPKNEEASKLLADQDGSAPTGGKNQAGRLADLSKVRRSRRSSVRFQRQSVESEEKEEGTSAQSLRSDSAKPKKGRRSSMRVPTKQPLGDQIREEEEQTTSKICDDKNMKHSVTDQSAQQEGGTSAAQVTAPSVVKNNRRKLMSLSSQCEPREELIVPTQSTKKNRKSVLSNDLNMFPGLGEVDESVSKKKQRTQKSTSRKRKILASSSESENDPAVASQGCSSTQDTTITLIPTSRRSLEEFKDHPSTRKKSRPASQAKKHKTSTLREVNSLSEEEEEDVVSSQESVTSRKGRKQKGRTRNASTLGSSTDSDGADSTLGNTTSKKRVRIASQSVRKSRKVKPTLVMTSMHASDQELVLSVAKALKHFKVIDTVCDTTTHVVCGDNRRTLNVLSAIARGCWLLSIEWVLNSVEAGHWLPEEPYELHDYFPAAQISRLERHAAGDAGYKQDLFAPPGSLYITEDSSPPKERLVELVELCGGQVAHRLKDATLCVGRVQQELEVPVVAEIWVLDCITQHCQMPLEPYFLNG